MSNFDLHKKWVQRYAERINQPPQNPPNTLPPAFVGAPDPAQQPQIPVSTPFLQEDFFFLDGAFGESIDKRIHEKYASIPAMDSVVYNSQEKKIKGSNPFYVVAVNEVFQERYPNEEIRTATQAELEQIVRNNPSVLKGTYEDSSLVWRSSAEPNEYLATKIYNQLKSTGKILEENHAYVLPLYAVSLEKDTNAPQSLAFKARGNSTFFPNVYFEAPILMSTSGKYISDADFDFTQGLPTKVFDSTQSILIPNRQLYTLVGGLSRFYLGSYLYVSADDDNLAGSDDGGRVVLVSGAATTQKNPGATP